jgi:CRP-like cAMP-binding protein
VSATIDPTPSLAGRFRSSESIVRVLDEEPELAGDLAGSRLDAARSQFIARALDRPSGPWPLLERTPDVGFLVLDGVLVREILLEDTVSAELLGPGDLLHDRPAEHPSRLLRANVRWAVVTPARVAVLGRNAATVLERFPELYSALLARVAERVERVAMTQAICQLNGVDRRVVSALWLLAERWGRVAGDGVVLPLPLPHRIIASLIGARRPTVSTALTRLTAEGTVERRRDGTWLLRGEPVGLPTAATSRFVPLRRPRRSVA